MNKEQRARQLTELYLQAIKGLEQGTIDDCVLVPFSKDEKVEVIVTKDGWDKKVTTVNAPF